MNRATEFREAAAEANRDRQRTGWRYPKALRRLAVAFCRDRRRAGRPYAEIVEELDITAMTLSRWLDDDEPQPAFRPVQVVEPQATSPSVPLRVVTSSGLEIEGLEFSQVLELARALR
jgi:predicted transcriptional regulator